MLKPLFFDDFEAFGIIYEQHLITILISVVFRSSKELNKGEGGAEEYH